LLCFFLSFLSHLFCYFFVLLILFLLLLVALWIHSTFLSSYFFFNSRNELVPDPTQIIAWHLYGLNKWKDLKAISSIGFIFQLTILTPRGEHDIVEWVLDSKKKGLGCFQKIVNRKCTLNQDV
jgi:hypothetical protein